MRLVGRGMSRSIAEAKGHRMETQHATMAECTAHVLVVVEDAALRELLQLVLDEEGYTVATAPDAALGLELLQASRSPLVVIHAITPHTSGAQLLGAALRDRPLAQRHAYVLLTTSAQPLCADLSQSVAVRHIAVVDLPFDLDALLAHVGLAAYALSATADPATATPALAACALA
jgi:CheY-like chemotaxis protein